MCLHPLRRSQRQSLHTTRSWDWSCRVPGLALHRGPYLQHSLLMGTQGYKRDRDSGLTKACTREIYSESWPDVGKRDAIYNELLCRAFRIQS